MFLRRTTSLTILLAFFGIAILCTARQTASWLFFGDAQHSQLLIVTLLCLVAVIGFNFLIELFTSLRQLRVVSYMQFANGLLFALFALGLIHLWDKSCLLYTSPSPRDS